MSAIGPGPIVEQATGYPQRYCACPHPQIDLCRRHWTRHAGLAMVPCVVRDMGVDVASKQDKPSLIQAFKFLGSDGVNDFWSSSNLSDGECGFFIKKYSFINSLCWVKFFKQPTGSNNLWKIGRTSCLPRIICAKSLKITANL